MIPYYYFNAFEEALWLDDQERAAERAELYFHGEVPDLVDRARIIEIERSLSHDPDLAEEVSHDFAPWTAPVPDDAEIQRGDPTVLSPEDVMGKQNDPLGAVALGAGRPHDLRLRRPRRRRGPPLVQRAHLD